MNGGIQLWQIKRIRLGGGKYSTVEILGAVDAGDSLDSSQVETTERSIRWSTALLIRLGLMNSSFRLATSPEEADNWQAAEAREPSALTMALTANLQSTRKRNPTSCERASDVMGVSGRMVAYVKVIKKESPEMFERMRRGEISTNAARRELKAAREAAKGKKESGGIRKKPRVGQIDPHAVSVGSRSRPSVERDTIETTRQAKDSQRR